VATTPCRTPRNRLLAALSPAEFDRIAADLDVIAIAPKQVLHRQGEPLEYVYFPNGGVFSMTTGYGDGSRVECATVGNEGLVGIAAFFRDDAISPGETMLQVPDGDTHRLSVTAFRRELAHRGGFHDGVGRYADAVMAHVMFSTGCMAHHAVQERCARWLLLTHDRVGSDEFDLSQEFLAMMLGVARQSVTIVAGTLQMAGLIRYAHGRITIVDRPRLESAACECYALIRSTYDRLAVPRSASSTGQTVTAAPRTL
jgi:CRP-like cAMP-binding protein